MAKGKNVSVPLTGQATMTIKIGTMKAQGFQPLPDDHPCYALIGQITSECARIEHFLDAAIFEFVGLQSFAKRGACITGQMVGMFPRYCALLQLALECEAPKPMVSEIKKLIQLSNGVSKRRNRAVHDAWMEDSSSGASHQFRTKAKDNPEYGPQPVTESMLKEDLAAVRIHLERVMKLRSEIWELHRA